MDRKDFFTRHEIEVPTTWDAYRNMTEQVRKADANARGGVLHTDNPGVLEALSWQAGGQRFATEKDSHLAGNLGHLFSADGGVYARWLVTRASSPRATRGSRTSSAGT
ncbi:hypothetical protein ACIQK9_34665 [Streptomyces hydrogenans]|uniref:hypothetical protein n=1 Tax=Streptomyces hydrogenans TaxID=1873719 RepID=UPI0037FF8CB2